MRSHPPSAGEPAVRGPPGESGRRIRRDGGSTATRSGECGGHRNPRTVPADGCRRAEDLLRLPARDPDRKRPDQARHYRDNPPRARPRTPDRSRGAPLRWSRNEGGARRCHRRDRNCSGPGCRTSRPSSRSSTDSVGLRSGRGSRTFVVVGKRCLHLAMVGNCCLHPSVDCETLGAGAALTMNRSRRLWELLVNS